MYGELAPLGGGDPIPLLKKNLLLGRRESCDIVLRFSNVSAHHCELTVDAGYWYVRDNGSRNGTKVNGIRVTNKRLDPGDTIIIAKHKYEVRYSPTELGAVGPPPADQMEAQIFNKSLLERAGLQKMLRGRKPPVKGPKPVHDGQVRFDLSNNDEGQLRDPNKPI